jgi:hypothetical protein
MTRSAGNRSVTPRERKSRCRVIEWPAGRLSVAYNDRKCQRERDDECHRIRAYKSPQEIEMAVALVHHL